MPEPTTPDPTELLRERGMQVTAQRIAVLDALVTRQHATADEVAAAARADIGAISRQAVYDALTVLVEHDLVRRIQPAGSPTRYERRVGDNHHHVVCRECGRTEDIDCVVGVAPCLDTGASSGYDIDEAEVVFWGRCPQCTAATTEG